MGGAKTVSIREGLGIGTGDSGEGSGHASIRELIVEKLALVDATDPAAIRRAMIEGGGDLVIDSQQAATVIAMVGQQLGCTLPGPEDLEPEEYTSIGSLTALVERKLRGTSPGKERA